MPILKSKDYPSLLKEIFNPPKKLHYQGTLSALNKNCLAIVGTRKNSEYGEFVTKKIISELAAYDFTIVSGLAYGIDTIAHQTAIQNDLSTIAVLGSGLNKIYPRCNKELVEEITANGLIISEYSDNMSGRKHHFPQRNRIISGLSVATVVIEAPEKSGSLITAEFALDQGRDIFVIPADIYSPNSQGILKLLQSGAAYPVSSGQEIIEQLKIQPELKLVSSEPTNFAFPKLNITPDQQQILTILSSHQSSSLENIHQKTKFSTACILANMSILELKGLIQIKKNKYLKSDLIN